MEQYTFPQDHIEYYEKLFAGSKVRNLDDNVLLIDKDERPFLRVSVDILVTFRLYVEIMHGGEWKPLFEHDHGLSLIDAQAIRDYKESGAILHPTLPKKWEKLSPAQRDEVLRYERLGCMEVELDEVTCALASSFFSDKPVMEINVSGFRRGDFSRRMLAAFNVDTTLADGQLAGTVDDHGEKIRKKKKAK